MNPVTFSIDATLAAGAVSALTRAGGLVATAPILAGEGTPAMLKVLITAGLAMAILPTAPASALISAAGPIETGVLLAAEALIGASLGFAARAVLSAAEGAGELLGFQSGVSMGQVFDPLTQQPNNPFAFIQGAVASQAFIVVGGLGWLALALARSYDAVPPMAGLAPAALLTGRLVALGSWVIEGSLLLLAPALMSAALLDLLILSVGRAVPALHLMIVALPLKVLTGFLLLALVTHHSAPALAALMDRARALIEDVAGLLSPALA